MKWLVEERNATGLDWARFVAVANGNENVVEWLDAKGAKDLAAGPAWRHKQLQRLVKRSGADLDQALRYAACNGHLETVQWLVEERNATDLDMARFEAAVNSNENVVDWLVGKGAKDLAADPAWRNKQLVNYDECERPLKTAHYLLERGANQAPFNNVLYDLVAGGRLAGVERLLKVARAVSIKLDLDGALALVVKEWVGAHQPGAQQGDEHYRQITELIEDALTRVKDSLRCRERELCWWDASKLFDLLHWHCSINVHVFASVEDIQFNPERAKNFLECFQKRIAENKEMSDLLMREGARDCDDPEALLPAMAFAAQLDLWKRLSTKVLHAPAARSELLLKLVGEGKEAAVKNLLELNANALSEGRDASNGGMNGLEAFGAAESSGREGIAKCLIDAGLGNFFLARAFMAKKTSWNGYGPTRGMVMGQLVKVLRHYVGPEKTAAEQLSQLERMLQRFLGAVVIGDEPAVPQGLLSLLTKDEQTAFNNTLREVKIRLHGKKAGISYGEVLHELLLDALDEAKKPPKCKPAFSYAFLGYLKHVAKQPDTIANAVERCERKANQEVDEDALLAEKKRRGISFRVMDEQGHLQKYGIKHSQAKEWVKRAEQRRLANAPHTVAPACAAKAMVEAKLAKLRQAVAADRNPAPAPSKEACSQANAAAVGVPVAVMPMPVVQFSVSLEVRIGERGDPKVKLRLGKKHPRDQEGASPRKRQCTSAA